MSQQRPYSDKMETTPKIALDMMETSPEIRWKQRGNYREHHSMQQKINCIECCCYDEYSGRTHQMKINVYQVPLYWHIFLSKLSVLGTLGRPRLCAWPPLPPLLRSRHSSTFSSHLAPPTSLSPAGLGQLAARFAPPPRPGAILSSGYISRRLPPSPLSPLQYSPPLRFLSSTFPLPSPPLPPQPAVRHTRREWQARHRVFLSSATRPDRPNRP